ncbi:MAG: hypothetical protein PSN37_02415 [Alphaproteobacteria bacterium]|nr:hypothetical protein [Alphaproteobacteria bacterium]
MKNRNIEIDLDLHKILECNRQSFSETECEILHRLFTNKERRRSIASLSVASSQGQGSMLSSSPNSSD